MKTYRELPGCEKSEVNIITGERWCALARRLCKFIEMCPLGHKKEAAMPALIEDRLEASLKIGAVNGDSFERTIVAKQIKEAIAEIRKLRKEIGKC